MRGEGGRGGAGAAGTMARGRRAAALGGLAALCGVAAAARGARADGGGGGGEVPDPLEGLAAQLREAFQAKNATHPDEGSMADLLHIIAKDLGVAVGAQKDELTDETARLQATAEAEAEAEEQAAESVEPLGGRELRGAPLDLKAEGGPLGVLKQMAEELQEEFGGEGDGPGAGATPLELLREGLRKELADGQAALEAACEGDTCDAPNVKAATPPRRPARLTEEQLAEARKLLTGHPALAELGEGLRSAEARIAEVKSALERMQSEGKTPAEMESWLEAQGLKPAAAAV